METDSNILDLEIKQGQDEELIITVQNADGTPVNITGYTFAGHLLGFTYLSFFIRDIKSNNEHWRGQDDRRCIRYSKDSN
jgi:hypothetical protein